MSSGVYINIHIPQAGNRHHLNTNAVLISFFSLFFFTLFAKKASRVNLK